MRPALLGVFCAAIVIVAVVCCSGSAHAKGFYDSCDDVTRLGVPCEHHNIITEDGMVLGAIRIPPKQAGAYPCLLQHGLLDSSATWTFNYHASQNLATILHNEGFDVWMGNSRFNHYSMKSTKYGSNPDDWPKLQWHRSDFVFMGRYDVKANIDYILNATGHKTLSYVGHSQGTSQFFWASKWHRDFIAEKVDSAHLLAPIINVRHTTALIFRILADLDVGTWIDIFGDKLFLEGKGLDWILRQISKVCEFLPFKQYICSSILMPLVGQFSVKDMNVTMLPNMLRYDPGGCSTRDMMTWAQSVRGDSYDCAQDYGSENNQLYNSSTPPCADVHLMGAKPPLFFTVGDQDALADPQDFEILVGKLQSGGALAHDGAIQEVTGWAHLDPVWSVDASTSKTNVYANVLAHIKKYMKN